VGSLNKANSMFCSWTSGRLSKRFSSLAVQSGCELQRSKTTAQMTVKLADTLQLLAGWVYHDP
jgi:hypothetical protein